MGTAAREFSKWVRIIPVKVADNISIISQGVRARQVSNTPVLRYGLSPGRMAAIFSISSVTSSCRMSMASSTVTMPTRRFSVSTMGRARKSYLFRVWATSSWSSRVLAEITWVSMMSPTTSSSSDSRMVRMERYPSRWRPSSMT